MNKIVKLFSCLLIFALFQCNVSPDEQVSQVSIYQNYCGSCHLATDPSNIPKSVWEKNVLPEMAARLGYQYHQYNPMAKVSMEEDLYIRKSNTYPKEAVIDSLTWQQIRDYILRQAPDSIPSDIQRSKRNTPLEHFKPSSFSLDKTKMVGITNIQFDTSTHQFMISDAYGKLYKGPKSVDTTQRFLSPVISYQQKDSFLFITEIGNMNPSEKPLGRIYRKHDKRIETLAQELHRPVFTEIIDINGDGKDEVLICEFGNLTGQLSILVQTTSQFEKRVLLPVPGTIKLEIADMNQDGKKDIIVLASQGNEGIYILYQKDELQFIPEQVIQMRPEYGSSWFQLMDYNGDQHLDIVLVNGDNADLSNFLKPYHGLRLFLNDGNNKFSEKWFYPIYGATRVLCEDYDMDGDFDFAVTAFFPDFENSQEESFVWLENKNAAKYLFEPHTIQKAKSGRWMVMENGDFDQDGDIDIMLGSYLLPMNRKKYKSVIEHWRSENSNLLLLENRTIN